MAASSAGKVKESNSDARGGAFTCPFSTTCPDTPATVQAPLPAVKLF